MPLRPALIMFTDGKHDVAGVPASRVQPTIDRLFGSRSPIAILPVGMGIAADDRAALEAGLNRMRIIKDMPACVSGATFDWPQTVFETADEAGTAVAVALQEATCTFTVVLPPTPAPTPPPSIPAVGGIKVVGGDGQITVSWGAPAAPPARRRSSITRSAAATGEGDSIESTEGVSLDRTAVVEGLTNGTEYQCEVAAIGPDSEGPLTPAALTVTPTGKPAPPGKPSVAALNSAVQRRPRPGAVAVTSRASATSARATAARRGRPASMRPPPTRPPRSTASPTAPNTSAARSPRTPSAPATRHRTRTP